MKFGMDTAQMYAEIVVMKESHKSMTIVQHFEVVHENFYLLGNLYQWRLWTEIDH